MLKRYKCSELPCLQRAGNRHCYFQYSRKQKAIHPHDRSGSITIIMAVPDQMHPWLAWLEVEVVQDKSSVMVA